LRMTCQSELEFLPTFPVFYFFCICPCWPLSTLKRLLSRRK
jgi:hypothetical protein